MKMILLVVIFSFLLVACSQVQNTLQVTSPAFMNNSEIPIKYSCDGEKLSPPLNIGNIPPETKTLALFLEDPDAPRGIFIHWVVWNIPPKNISENSTPGIVGINSAGKNNYVPPCPPSGTHRYFFMVYALDMELNISSDSDKKAVENAMRRHVIADGELVGLHGNV